ncbi:MAG: TetR/AcrR family transcriptional regulator [Clostridiales bacterium]|nr:TetR/AcrR family transcriptional regulator [Candidatus Crickella caballi]
MSKASKSTRERIVSAAWKLFYAQGYDDTTIDDIVESANVSKGSFYHYFDGKESLIDGISFMFDTVYEDIMADLDESLNPLNKLTEMTKQVFFMIENTVPVHLLSRIMASQMSNKGDKYLVNPDRPFFRFVRKIVIEGKEASIFNDAYSVNEIAIAYALFERGLMYDWCVSNGNYSFSQYAEKMMAVFLNGFTLPPPVR